MKRSSSQIGKDERDNKQIKPKEQRMRRTRIIESSSSPKMKQLTLTVGWSSWKEAGPNTLSPLWAPLLYLERGSASVMEAY